MCWGAGGKKLFLTLNGIVVFLFMCLAGSRNWGGKKFDPVRRRLWWGGSEAVEVPRKEEMPQCVDNHTQLCPWIELSSSCPYGFRDQRLPTALFPPCLVLLVFFRPVWYFLVFSLCLVFSFVYRSPGWYVPMGTQRGFPQSQRKFPFLSVVLSPFLYLSYFPCTVLTTTRLLLKC